MPRGRHRHSPPLHRLLPPLTLAGSAAVLAVGAWFSPSGDHGMVLRALVTAAAAVAGIGSILLRSWDRAAGKQVAELRAAKLRDEWRTEERIAELETDVEEAREVRRRIQAKLRAKRAELSRLRGEHAELLRRYATAETARARALESRRQLALESAAPRTTSTAVDRAYQVSPVAYLRAAEALRNLSRNAARQLGPVPGAQDRTGHPADRELAAGNQHKFALPPAPSVPVQGSGPGGRPASRPAIAPASAIVPQTERPAARPPQGGFDFFGTTREAREPKTVETRGEDLADVVGDEAYAEHTEHAVARAEGSDVAEVTDEVAEAAAEVAEAATAPGPDEPEVIDLTAHDETEQLDLRALHAQ